MEQDELRKALKSRSDKLYIIAVVTGISEERLKQIVEGDEMSTFEFITLKANA